MMECPDSEMRPLSIPNSNEDSIHVDLEGGDRLPESSSVIELTDTAAGEHDEEDSFPHTPPLRPIGDIMGHHSRTMSVDDLNRPTNLYQDPEVRDFIREEKETTNATNDEIYQKATERHQRNIDIKIHDMAFTRGMQAGPLRDFLNTQPTPLVPMAGTGKPPLLSSILSGLVCGVLMFVFCSVFGYIIFEGKRLEHFAPIAVDINLVSAMITGLGTAYFSACRVSVASPDINPTIFLAIAAKVVTSNIAIENEKAILPTVLATIVCGTWLVAIAFYLIGHFRGARMAAFMPASVLRGFLATVGYKVMAEALTVATGFHVDLGHLDDIFGTWFGWKLLLPAIPIGLLLYVSKRYHIGKPTKVFPVLLLTPVLLFYIIIFACGMSIDDARESGWFFPTAVAPKLYDQWSSLYGHLYNVKWSAFGQGVMELVAMVIIVLLDFLLKLAGTEKSLNMDIDLDNELVLAGKLNALNALAVGVPAYGQMKFNVMNHGITNSVNDATAGYIASGFCGVLFLLGFPLINYLPRFFLAGLLIFAAMGFLVENLWESRLVLSRKELVAVWSITLVGIALGLLIAVIVGICGAAIIFAIHYAKRSDVTEFVPLQSTMVRPVTHARKLEMLSADLVLCVKLHGLLFWGSASRIQELIEEQLAKHAHYPKYRKVRWLILGLKEVSSMDSSAANIFIKIKRMGRRHGFRVVLAGVSDKLIGKLRNEKVITETTIYFPTMDLASEYVEEAILADANNIRSKWLVFPAMRMLNAKMVFQALHSPWTKIIKRFGVDAWRYFEHEIIDPETHKETHLESHDFGNLSIYSPVASVREMNHVRLQNIDEHYSSSDDDGDNGGAAGESRRRQRAEGRSRSGSVSRTKWEGVGRKAHTLYHVGQDMPKLYILENGRVSSYLEHEDGTRSRVGCQTEGVFLGSILDMPCSETVEIDGISSFYTITKANLQRLRKERPQLALNFERRVLIDTMKARNRLERSLDHQHTHEHDTYTSFLEEREHDVYKQSALISKLAKSVASQVVFHLGANNFTFKSPPCSAPRSLQTTPVTPDGTCTEEGGEAQTPEEMKTGSDHIGPRLNARTHHDQPLLLPIRRHRSNNKTTLPGGLIDAAQMEQLNPVVHLNNDQCREYTAYFQMHSHKDRSVGGGDEQVLDVKHLRHILLDQGSYVTGTEIRQLLEKEGLQADELLNLSQFLMLMTHMLFAELEEEQIFAYYKVFMAYDSDSSGGLSAEQINRLFNEAIHTQLDADDLESLVQEWEDEREGELVFSEFLSMLAFAIKRDDLDRRINHDFGLLARTNRNPMSPISVGSWRSQSLNTNAYEVVPKGCITAEKLRRVLQSYTRQSVPLDEAAEMIWHSGNSNQELDFRAFIDMISAVYEPGWIVLYNWITRRHVRLFHSRLVDGEFEAVDDAPETLRVEDTPLLGAASVPPVVLDELLLTDSKAGVI